MSLLTTEKNETNTQQQIQNVANNAEINGGVNGINNAPIENNTQ
jgi:hypothetical protein